MTNIDEAKLSQVKEMVETFAEADEYEEFVRFMFSVGLYDNELQFNYIHPMILQSAITPTLRQRVIRNRFDNDIVNNLLTKNNVKF